MNNKISVIIPSFNREYILPTALNSVVAQTYNNWEVIVVDDGSTDNTKDIVNNFHDKRIKYYHQKKSGPSFARNTGLSRIKGEWVVYLDSDNELLPNYMEAMIKHITKNKKALYLLPKGKRTLELYKNNQLVKTIDDSKDFLKNLTIKDVFMRNIHFDGNGFMHHRKIVDEGLRWDNNLNRMEEWDFVMTIAENYPDSFMYVPVILFNYHQRFGGDGLVSNTTYLQWADAFEYIYQKHKNDKLLSGQKWYPDRVEKYKKMDEDYKKGIAPEPHLRYFS